MAEGKIGLYRSQKQHMIAGVMGGIAERFGWNANLLRLVFIAVSVMSAAFPGILVYLILWLVMPKQHNMSNTTTQPNQMKTVYEDRTK